MWQFLTKEGAQKRAPAQVICPSARLKQTVAQTIGSLNTWTAFTGLSVDFDTDNMVSGQTIVIQHAGKYLLHAGFMYVASSGTGARIKVNGTPVAMTSGAAAASGQVASVVMNLAVGDVISGEGLIMSSAASDPTETFLSATKIDGAVISYVGIPGSLIGQEFGYVEKTTDVNVTSSSEAAPTDVISLPSINFDGSTKVDIEFFTSMISIASGIGLNVGFYQDGAILGTIGAFGAEVISGPYYMTRRFTPPSGNHVYKIGGFKGNPGTPVISGGPGGSGQYMPMFLRIKRAP